MQRRVGDVLRTQNEDLQKDKQLLQNALQDGPLGSFIVIRPFIQIQPCARHTTGADRHQEAEPLPGGRCCLCHFIPIRQLGPRTSLELQGLLGHRWSSSWRRRKPLDSSKRPRNLLESPASLNISPPSMTGRAAQLAEKADRGEEDLEGRGGARAAFIDKQTWKQLHARRNPRTCT